MFMNENPEAALDEQATDMLVQRIAWVRALHLWFQGAHHVVRGTSFAGDHVSLYERIYTANQDEVDGATEKVIGLTGDEAVACPKLLAARALEIMEEYPSPVGLNPQELARTGLQLEQDYIVFVEGLFHDLEEAEMMSIGLNDQLSASANAHETFVYLLGQRARDESSR